MDSEESQWQKKLNQLYQRHQVSRVAEFHPNVHLIRLYDFNYADLPKMRTINDEDSEFLRNYATYVHEVTHFHQSIGTIYGIDNIILQLSNTFIIPYLLQYYKNFSEPQNPKGRYIPLIEFARAELRSITSQPELVPGNKVCHIVPHGIMGALNHFVTSDNIVRYNFDGLPPILLDEFPSNFPWQHLKLGSYWLASLPLLPNLQLKHLFFIPDCYRGSDKQCVVGIGARAIQETWATAVEAFSCNQESIYPEQLRQMADENKNNTPSVHDYYSAFDYMCDHIAHAHQHRLLETFLVCADIALMYSGFIEHDIIETDIWLSSSHPQEFRQLLKKGLMDRLSKLIYRSVSDLSISTPAEVFADAVEAARSVRPLCDETDFPRFMADIIAAMDKEPIQDRVRWYLNQVLLPFSKKFKMRYQDFEKELGKKWKVSDEFDADDYRLDLCAQALRARLLFPDFFVNIWNNKYRQRLTEQFRLLNIIDPTGELVFTSTKNSFLLSWFFDQLLSGKDVVCPKIYFGITCQNKFRCVLGERLCSHQEPNIALHPSEDLSECEIKRVYDDYELNKWRTE